MVGECPFIESLPKIHGAPHKVHSNCSAVRARRRLRSQCAVGAARCRGPACRSSGRVCTDRTGSSTNGGAAAVQVLHQISTDDLRTVAWLWRSTKRSNRGISPPWRAVPDPPMRTARTVVSWSKCRRWHGRWAGSGVHRTPPVSGANAAMPASVVQRLERGHLVAFRRRQRCHTPWAAADI